LSGFKFTPTNSRLLHRALFWAADRQNDFGPWTCSNIYTDCAWYPGSRKLVVINSSDKPQDTTIADAGNGSRSIGLTSHGIEIIDL
jgi:hypothetical protein